MSNDAKSPKSDGRVRVIIVDDNPSFRRELRLFLESSGDIKVIGEAENGLRAVELSEHRNPDVVLMDQNMPSLSGVEATRRIKASRPRTRVIFVAAEGRWEKEAVQAGAERYFLKDDDLTKLLVAIQGSYAVLRQLAEHEPQRGVGKFLKNGWLWKGLTALCLISYLAALVTSLEMTLVLTALFFGIFFFVYGLKYYLSVALILFATSGNVNANGNKNGSLNGRLNGWLNGKRNGRGNGKGINGKRVVNGGNGRIPLHLRPFISIHLPLYNEIEVVDRLLTACTSLDYENYEIIVADDSTDKTTKILQERWESHPRVKISHRVDRSGFKGGALKVATQRMDPKAEFVVIFDADFVPPPDILHQFLSYFYGVNGSNGNHYDEHTTNISLLDDLVAVVQGYQWHMLNASENWITRGVRTEFSGSYVIERSGQEMVGSMKMISGSVFMIRADVLRQIGWRTSITEDWELTLRLYLEGYKVLYTPFIQAPAECVATFAQLTKQRMRWAEGHTFNVKKYFLQVLSSTKINLREKLEFIYYAPYYLQSVLFLLGTGSWLISDFILNTRLPFWTTTLGWSLVFVNAFSLVLMNLSGLFLERGVRRNWKGLFSFVLLTFLLVPYQAYAAIKGLIEPDEGGWHRTQKTGVITEVLGRLGMRRRLRRLRPKKKRSSTGLAGQLGASTSKLTGRLGILIGNLVDRLGMPTARLEGLYDRVRSWIKRLIPQPLKRLTRRIGMRVRVAFALGISLLLLIIFSARVLVVSAAPDIFFLRGTATNGASPAGQDMNNDQGSSEDTLIFNSTDDEAYWYTDLTYPTGGDDASIAAGNYTLNMYFDQLPQLPADWYDANWYYRKKITIDAGLVSADQSNFPVLISLPSDTELAADAQDDGDDILFTSSNGTTKLSHEIEYFNDSTGELQAWVKVLNISSTLDTELYIYYGNASAGTQQDKTGVWSNGYREVFHLNESSGTLYDSTTSGYTGTAVGNAALGAAGRIATAVEFDGSAGSHITLADGSMASDQTFTFSAWVWADTLNSEWEGIVTKGRDSLVDWQGLWIDGSNQLIFGWECPPCNVGGSTLSAGQWYYAAATYDGTDLRLYRNNALVGGPTTGSHSSSIDENTLIGEDLEGSVLDGIVDEVRISTDAHSLSWIATEYNNQWNQGAGAGKFIKTLGSEEAAPRVQITVSVYDTQADGGGAQEIITTSSPITIDSNTPSYYELDIGSTGSPKSFPASNPPRRLRVYIKVTEVNGSGSFTLAYDSASAPTSLDTPSLTIPGVTVLLLVVVVLIPVLTSLMTRKRRLTVWILTIILSLIVSLTLLAQQVFPVSAAPDKFYLRDTTTNGASPAGQDMNLIQGSSEDTILFDATNYQAYWYTDITYPIGDDDASIAAGDYSLNMHFDQLPGSSTWWDAAYGYRKELTITAGTSDVPSGYSVTLTFDHESLVDMEYSQSDGDDIAITYWNGSGWVELDRILDPGSSWNTDSTTIWFQTQASISASTSDSDYDLYYGNPSVAFPPADGESVFYFYDGFESGDLSVWDDTVTGSGDSILVDGFTVHTGGYAAEAYVDDGTQAAVENFFAGQQNLLTSVWVYLPSTYNAGSDIELIQYYTGGSTKIASLSIDTSLRPYINNFVGSQTYTSDTALTTGAWHRLEMKIRINTDPSCPTTCNGRAELWQDGLKKVDEPGIDTGTGNIDHKLAGISWKPAGSGEETIYIDDTFDRLWLDSEPTTGLDLQETPPSVDIEVSVAHSKPDGTDYQIIINSSIITIDATTSNPYPLDIGFGSAQAFSASEPRCLLLQIEVDDTNNNGSFTLAYNSSANPSSLDTPSLMIFDVTILLLFVAVFIPILTSILTRKRRLATWIVSILISLLIALSLLGQQVLPVSAAPDTFYLRDTTNNGASPAGEDINSSQGSSEDTLLFDDVNDEAYWYTELTYPTGEGDASIAGGDYTLNMYFDQLPSSSGWYDTNWSYRKKITIDHDEVDGDQNNFPVLIRFTSDDDLADHAQENGDDILFTSDNGTSKLSHEIEKFDVETGELVAWVKTDLSGGTDTDLYMYYGYATAENQETVEDVWSDFVAVLHLSEDPSTESYAYDSTQNDNDGTMNNMDSNNQVPGQVGGSFEFNGNDESVDMSHSSSLDITGNQVTLSVWMKADSNINWNWNKLIHKPVSNSSWNPPYTLYELSASDEGDSRQPIFAVTTGGGNYTKVTSSQTIDTTNWWHIVGVYEGSQLEIFINGISRGTTPKSGNIDSQNTSSPIAFRGDGSSQEAFEGIIDEVRISETERTAEWIGTSFNNQSSPSSFYKSIGSEETQPSVDITVSVYHTKSDGTDPQAIVTSSTVTIDSSTPSYYELPIGSGSAEAFTSADPRRLRVLIDVTAVNTGGSFTLAYDSSANHSSLDTPSMVVPEATLLLVILVLLIPVLTFLLTKNRRRAIRLVTVLTTFVVGLGLLANQVGIVSAAPDVLYLHDTDTPSGVAWYDPDWVYRKKITIHDAEVMADLDDFPVLISLTSDENLADYAQDDGDDILFTSSNGTTKLSHEIEKFNGGTGELVAWVQVDLDGDADTVIYMYYGNGSVGNQQNIPGVWDGSFEGVWHLDEISGQHNDSTSNGNNSTSVDVATQGSATGQIDGADDFNGSNNDITIGDDDTLDITDAITIEAWVEDDINERRRIVTKGGEIYVLRSDYTGRIQAYINKGGTLYYAQSQNDLVGTIGYHYVVLTWDGVSGDNNLRLYHNGFEIGSYADQDSITSPLDTSTSDLFIGSHGSGEYWNGRIDEVRISSTARTAEWIETSYNNQYNPSAFYDFDSQETITITPAGKFMNTTLGSGAATLVFDSTDDETYWYTDLTYPTEDGDASIAVGDYKLTMHFDQLPAAWYDSAWSSRKKLTIDSTMVTANFTAFPVLVSMTDADLVGNTQGDGGDILFTTDDGTTKLDHEIESFNSGTGELVAWVEVTSLSSSSDTDIYMYYGNGSASDQWNVAGTWDSNYIGVWHLDETGAGNPDEYQDSSQYLNHGQGGEGDPLYVPAQVGGKIGYGQDFNIVYAVGDATVAIDSNIVTFGSAYIPLDIQNGDYLIIDPGGGNEESFIVASRDSETQVTTTTNATIAHTAEAYILYNRDQKYDLIDVGNDDMLDAIGDEITLEAWVWHNASMPPAHQVYGILNHKGWSAGYSLWIYADQWMCPSGEPMCVTFNLPGETHQLGSEMVLSGGTWHHVVVTYDGSLPSGNMKVFIDGVQDTNTLDKTGDITAPSPPDDDVWIGHGDQPTDVGWSGEWVGQLDEVRISDSARTLEWIETSYYNQDNQGTGTGKFIKTLGSAEAAPSVEITVSVYHTDAIGGDPQEIITSSTITIDSNTSNPYDLDIGSGSAKTFTSADPRRLRVYIDVTAVAGTGSFTLAYDSSADPSSLDTPSMVIPELTILLIAVVILIPILTALLTKKRRLAVRLIGIFTSLIIALSLLSQQVLPTSAAPDVFYLHDTGTGSGVAWYDTDWAYRKKITINAGEVAGDLSGFPVLINQSSDAELSASAQTDGGDILFTSDNGTTKLDHEIETYVTGTGELVAWVEVPSLSGSVNTVLYMYYGNGTVADQWNINGTWDDNYVVVHHLSDLVDSTQYGNNGTNNGATSTTSGRAGDAYNFDSSTDYIEIADDPTLDLTGNHTLSVWINGADNDSDYQGVIVRPNAANDDWDYALIACAGGDDPRPSYYNDLDILSASVDVNNNDWTYLVATWNGTNRIIYVDGQNRGSDNHNPGIQNNGNPLFIGDSGEVLWDEGYVGIIDEVRVSDYPRTASWIQTSFNNQGLPSSFYGLDSQETPSITPAGKYMNTTEGTGGSTLIFDSTDDEGYWYTELTYPTGDDNASIAAGPYTLDMYFDQLPQVPADWYDADWDYRKKITIDSGLVPANILNFPVLISLTSDSDLGNDAQDDGDDILFTSSNGTSKLSHEIERFNDSSGELMAWVKVNLSSSADTDVYVYYGNDSVGSQEDVANVWSNGFIGVWHLDETGSTVSDSTSPSYDGTVSGASPNSSAQIDGGFDFVRSEVDEIEMFGTGNVLSLTDFTVEAWMKTPDSDVADDYYAVTQSLYCDNGESWALNIADDSGHLNEGRFTTKESSDQSIVYSNSTVTGNAWHYLAGVRTSTQLLIYVDGSYANAAADDRPGEVIQSNNNISIGSAICVDTEDFNGTIDEVRISSEARNADWIATTHNNQDNQGVGVGKFIESLASEETFSLPSVEIAVSVYHTSADGSDPQEIVTSSTVTIDANTSPIDPYVLTIGNDPVGQIFDDPLNPRRLRVHIDVTAVSGGGSFTLAYDSSADPSSLDTPSMVIPELTILMIVVVVLIPIVTALMTKKRRLAIRLIGIFTSLIIALSLLSQQVLPTSAAPDVFYLRDSAAGGAWYDPDWSYRKKITIYASEVTADESYFPVLINQSSDTELAASAQADGGDILFTSANGTTKLDHEIEKYITGTGELVAWVEVENLSGSVNTVLYMYYGNGTVADQWNINGTWETNYKGVWHLAENPGPGGSGDIIDSTSNNKHGTAEASMLAEDLVPGQIGDGIDFDGGDDYLWMPDPLDGSNMTFSAWIEPTASSNDWITIAQRDDDDNTWYDWQVYARATDAPTQYHAVGRIDLDQLEDADEEVESDIVLSINTPYYITVTYNGTDLLFYRDGQLRDTYTESGTIPDSNADMWIARNNPWVELFTGIIDEVRVSNTPRTASWIETSYKNQYDPSNFYELDVQETPGITPAGKYMNTTEGTGGSTLVFDSTDDEGYWYTELTYPIGDDDASIVAGAYTLDMYFDQIPQVPADWYDANWFYRKKITIDAGLVTGNQTDFPVLVSLPLDSDLADKAQNAPTAGYDILFTSSNGTTKLSHEIEEFNDSTGELQAWVKADLSGSTDTEIYVYYGNTSVDNQEDATGVWDSNYGMIQHMNDATSSTIEGSTSNGITGTKGSSNNPNEVSGEIGNAQYFNSDTDLIAFDDNDIWIWNPVTQDRTLSLWWKSTSLPNAQDEYQMFLWGDQSGGRKYVFMLVYNVGEIILMVSIVDSDYVTVLGNFWTSWSPDTNQWYHIALVASSDNNCRVYVDGISQTVNYFDWFYSAQINPGTIQTGAALGNIFDNETIDELRFSHTARSAGWIATSHNNQSKQGVGVGKFIESLSGEETLPSVEITVSVYHTKADGSDPQVIVTSSTVTIDNNTPLDNYQLPIGSGAEQIFDDLLNPRRLRVHIDVTAVNGGGSFTLAYDSSADPSSLDTPFMVVPEWGLAFLLLIPLVPYLMSAIWRRKRLAGKLASIMLGISVALGLLANQVTPATAAPDVFYLHSNATSGLTPAGEYMNITEGSSGTTKNFSSTGSTYWYADASWPTGDDNATIAAGDYTFNMYFNQLPSAAGQVNFETFAENSTSGDQGSVTVTKPTGTVEDDLLVATMSHDSTSGTLAAPVGWTPLFDTLSSGGSTFRAWYKIAGDSEPADYAFTSTDTDQLIASIMRFTGHDLTDPIDISGTNTGSSNAPTAPSVTTTVDNALVLRVFGADDDDITVDSGYPGSHTGVFVRGSGGSWGETSIGAAYTTQASPGATGTAAFSMTASEQWAAATIAIAPSAADAEIDITVSVYHTAPDGSDATEIVTSSTKTITGSTADPYALDIGSALQQTFTSSDPRRLRLHVTVDSISGGGSFVLDYDGTCASNRCSNLDTPVVVVPEAAVVLVPVVIGIPMLISMLKRKKKKRVNS